MRFTKMHGSGNDYIYFNCLEKEIDNPEELSIKLSDRHFGVGGDGIVLICASSVADAKMRMFNADGSEGKMCGNAIRCVGKYLYDNHITNKTALNIETLSGIKELELFTNAKGKVDKVRVNMGAPILDRAKIPVTLENTINVPVFVGGMDYNITCVSMGNPHCITFMEEDISEVDIEQEGPLFEYHPIFPDRVNTEFVNMLSRNAFKMRVWERGSGETLACGTGACAVAVAAVLNKLADYDKDIKIRLLGGELTVKYTGDTVYMTGPATTVFEGELYED